MKVATKAAYSNYTITIILTVTQLGPEKWPLLTEYQL